MFPSPHLANFVFEYVCRRGRIVQQSQVVVGRRDIAVKEGLGKTKTQCYCPHHLDVQCLASLIEGIHGFAEGNARLVGGRPVVGECGVVVSSDFHGLLQVWVLAAQGIDSSFVGELRDLFAALRDIATVGFGGGLLPLGLFWIRGIHTVLYPFQCVFLLLRSAEEFRRAGKDFIHGFLWDSMVFEVAAAVTQALEGVSFGFGVTGGVQKTGVFEAVNYASNHGLLIGFPAIQKQVEVDKLQLSGSTLGQRYWCKA
jgi:hypothetical protein